MLKMYSLVFLWCVAAIVTADKEAPKRDSVLSSIDTGEVHSKFKEGNHEDEIRAAFPIMDAFKGHSLLTADDLKDKKEYSYADEESIDRAVQIALRKLHKKKAYLNEAVDKATIDPNVHHSIKHAAKRNITAKEVVDEVVKDEIKRHHSEKHSDSSDEDMNDDSPSDDEESHGFEKKIHKKLVQISSLEHKLAGLVSDVKKFLKKKKSQDPSSDNVGLLEDNDDVERIMAYGNKKRSEIPRSHISLIQKYRNNPELVDNYIDNILDSKDESTTNGEQRDLLGKKETESALLRDALPNGDINSIPLSRLDKESEDYDNMATDRGIARDALIESPFSMLDIKQTTGTKFRHGIS